MFLKKLGVAFASLLLAVLVAVNPGTAVAATQTWTDAGDKVHWSDPANWSGGALAAGDHIIFDNTSQTFDGETINDLTGANLAGLTFTGSSMYYLGVAGNPYTLSGSVTSEGNGVNVLDTNVYGSGKLVFTAKGDSVLGINTGRTVYFPQNVGLRSYDNGYVYIVGGLRGTGTGIVYISGPTTWGTYLESTGRISGAKTVVNSGGYLWGSGATSTLVVSSSSHLFPEKCLTTGSLTLDGYFYVRMRGKNACSTYSQLKVNGLVDIAGAKFYLPQTIEPGFAPNRGSTYTILSNNGTDKIRGTFNGLPEGKSFRIGAYTFRITYKGGPGANDIVLKRL